jgi:hypothetical protein
MRLDGRTGQGPATPSVGQVPGDHHAQIARSLYSLPRRSSTRPAATSARPPRPSPGSRSPSRHRPSTRPRSRAALARTRNEAEESRVLFALLVAPTCASGSRAFATRAPSAISATTALWLRSRDRVPGIATGCRCSGHAGISVRVQTESAPVGVRSEPTHPIYVRKARPTSIPKNAPEGTSWTELTARTEQPHDGQGGNVASQPAKRLAPDRVMESEK